MRSSFIYIRYSEGGLGVANAEMMMPEDAAQISMNNEAEELKVEPQPKR